MASWVCFRTPIFPSPGRSHTWRLKATPHSKCWGNQSPERYRKGRWNNNNNNNTHIPTCLHTVAPNVLPDIPAYIPASPPGKINTRHPTFRGTHLLSHWWTCRTKRCPWWWSHPPTKKLRGWELTQKVTQISTENSGAFFFVGQKKYLTLREILRDT